MSNEGDRRIMITNMIRSRRGRIVEHRESGPVFVVLLDDGTPDPSWAGFKLKPGGDYVDMGPWGPLP
jgi:hypothetical protein